MTEDLATEYEQLQPPAQAAGLTAQLEESGFCVVPDVVGPELVAALKRVINQSDSIDQSINQSINRRSCPLLALEETISFFVHNNFLDMLVEDGERGRIFVLGLGTAPLGPCFHLCLRRHSRVGPLRRPHLGHSAGPTLGFEGT